MLSEIGWYARYPTVLRTARLLSRQRLVELRPKRLLTLCYGNIYRSPFAQHLLTRSLGREGFESRSAGFHPETGRRSPEHFVELAAGLGIDLSAHRSTVITSELLDWADIVFIMDRRNWRLLHRMRPIALDHVAWLASFEGGASVEILDPYGKEPQVIEEIARGIVRCVDGLSAALRTQR